MASKQARTGSIRVGASLTEDAYNALRKEILACRLQPGAKLNISDLRSRTGFGLSAIREALSRLTSEGLVMAEPQRGFRVAPMSEADLKDLTRLRIDVESQCILRSVQAGDIAWEGRVLASFHEMARIPRYEDAQISQGWIKAHARFHATLVEACDSPWLLRLRDLLFVHSERYRVMSIRLDRPDLDQEHLEIKDAVLARDAEKAAALMSEHIRRTATIILSSGFIDKNIPPDENTGHETQAYTPAHYEKLYL